MIALASLHITLGLDGSDTVFHCVVKDGKAYFLKWFMRFSWSTKALKSSRLDSTSWTLLN